MRRSGSSSCMLRPKDECTDDEADISLSVTLLNKEQLPSYCVERFYMLSEIDHHVHSTQFLCDFPTRLPVATTEPPSLSDHSTACGAPLVDRLPQCCILYLLWKHDATTSPTTFCEEVVCKALEKLQTLVDIEPSHKPSASPSRSSSSSDWDSPRSNSNSEVTTTATRKKMRVYLVVDRCVPDQLQEQYHPSEPQQLDVSTSLSNKQLEEVRHRRHYVQVDLAEKLARTVATNSLARDLCEGITVGVADHIRAAPGLEACLNAISFGAADRRRAALVKSGRGAPLSKSTIGIITNAPSDLLGLQGAETEPDAAEGVLQCRIIAEWSGRGNLQSFARRAHSQWRKVNNLHMDINDPFRSRRVVNLSELSCDKLTATDVLSSAVKLLFWIGVLVWLWHSHGDSFPPLTTSWTAPATAVATTH